MSGAPCVALFGGSGFVGTHLANQLVRAGYGLRVFTRDREHARGLWLLPATDVIVLDVADEERVATAMAGCVAAVNLIGRLNERRDNGADFRRAHVDTVQHLIKACKNARVPHLVHMSALKADIAAPSHYLRSKGEAEKLLLAENNSRLRTTVLRPSVIFGPDDALLNRFASLLRLAPGVMPLTSAEARLQPVYVGDVVAALVKVIAGRAADLNTRYELVGPEVMTLRQIVAYVAALTSRPTMIIPLGGLVATLFARVMEFVPGKPLTRDNLRSLSVDSVCTGDNGLLALGIRPTPLDEIAPAFLGGRTQRAHRNGWRREAGMTGGGIETPVTPRP